MASAPSDLDIATFRPPTTAKTEADPLKADFRNFLWVIWKHLALPDPTPVQYDIASFLQHGPRRCVIEAFRGVGKSWVTSAYVCWLLYCYPQRKIMVVSASKQRADDFSTFTLRLIHDIEVLQHLRPKDDQRSSKVAFDVGPARPDHSPSVKSVGITGQLTGSRADYIIADDIEVVSNSATQALRDRLAELVKEFDAVIKPASSNPNAKIIYLGTPQCEQSLYNELPARGYVARIWPSRYPTPAKREKYGAKLAPYIANMLDSDPTLGVASTTPSGGQPTDGLRFSDEDLLERELSYGRSGYALQFQLDTSLSDADRYPLRLRDLIVHPLDPHRAPSDLAWASSPELRYDVLPAVGLNGDHYFRPMWLSPDFAPYEGTVLFADPSGRGKDETAWAIVKMLHGRLFLTGIGAKRGEGYSEEVLRAICMDAKKHDVNLMLCEPNYGGGMFTQMLSAASQRYYPVTVEDAKWVSGQKEARIIDTLEPLMNQHRLVVCPSVIEQDYRSTENYTGEDSQRCRLFFQMTRITRDRGALAHDDRLDAVAGACAHWLEFLNRDTEQAHAAHKEQLIEDDLENFMKHQIFGSQDDDQQWSSTIMRTR